MIFSYLAKLTYLLENDYSNNTNNNNKNIKMSKNAP